MILTWPDADLRRSRAARRREDRYQATMSKAYGRCPDKEVREAWFTCFAFLPRRINDTTVVWLDWFEATPVGAAHGSHGGRNGFAPLAHPLYHKSAWGLRTKKESMWAVLARTIVWKISGRLQW